MVFVVDNCSKSKKIVEKVNKNAHNDELRLIVCGVSVLYNIFEVNCNEPKRRSVGRCC